MLAAGIDHELCVGHEAVGLLNSIVKEVGDVIETIQGSLLLLGSQTLRGAYWRGNRGRTDRALLVA